MGYVIAVMVLAGILNLPAYYHNCLLLLGIGLYALHCYLKVKIYRWLHR